MLAGERDVNWDHWTESVVGLLDDLMIHRDVEQVRVSGGGLDVTVTAGALVHVALDSRLPPESWVVDMLALGWELEPHGPALYRSVMAWAWVGWLVDLIAETARRVYRVETPELLVVAWGASGDRRSWSLG